MGKYAKYCLGWFYVSRDCMGIFRVISINAFWKIGGLIFARNAELAITISYPTGASGIIVLSIKSLCQQVENSSRLYL